jgi:putative Mn2+ efflux pump MntP
VSLWAVVLTAFAVSADAFVVALGRGTSMRRLDVRAGVVLACVFGACQAVMPLGGWVFGSAVEGRVSGIDHWCAFVLLAAVGGKMLLDSLRTAQVPGQAAWGLPVVLALGVATSAKPTPTAKASTLVEVDIVLAVLLIGGTAFVLSCAGIVVGQRAGVRHRRAAGALGGILLVALGLRILMGG